MTRLTGAAGSGALPTAQVQQQKQETAMFSVLEVDPRGNETIHECRAARRVYDGAPDDCDPGVILTYPDGAGAHFSVGRFYVMNGDGRTVAQWHLPNSLPARMPKNGEPLPAVVETRPDADGEQLAA